MKKQKYLIILALIILLGLTLRLYDINTESAWFDEGFTLKAIDQENISGLLHQTDLTETKPPLFSIILFYLTKIFPLSITTIRMFSALVGTLSIFLLYNVMKEMFDEKNALLASFLFSISFFDILYSQEGRVFTLFTTLSLVSFLFFIKLIKDKNSNSKFYLYLFFANIFLNSIHYISWVIILIQNMIFLQIYFKNKTSIRRWFFYQSLTIVAFIPFLPKLVNKSTWLHYTLIKILNLKLSVPLVIAKLGLVLFLIPIIIGLIVTFLIIKNWDKINNWFKTINKNILVMFILGFYALIFIFIKSLYHPFFLTRYTLFVLPIIYLVFSKVICEIKNKKHQILIITIICLLTIGSLSMYYKDTTKEEWDHAAEFIQSNEKLGESIFFDTETAYVPFEYYYNGNLTFLLTDGTNYKQIQELNSPFWIILSHNKKDIDFYNNLISKDLYLANKQSYYGIDVYYYSDINLTQ